jgi:hypothetical protein
MEENIYAITPRTMEDIVARLQPSIPTCEDVFEGMPCGGLLCTSRCTEAASNTYCNNEAYVI